MDDRPSIDVQIAALPPTSCGPATSTAAQFPCTAQHAIDGSRPRWIASLLRGLGVASICASISATTASSACAQSPALRASAPKRLPMASNPHPPVAGATLGGIQPVSIAAAPTSLASQPSLPANWSASKPILPAGHPTAIRRVDIGTLAGGDQRSAEHPWKTQAAGSANFENGPTWNVYISQPPIAPSPPLTVVNIPPSPPTPEPVVDATAERRERIAKLVSQNNLASPWLNHHRSDEGSKPPMSLSDSVTADQLLRTSEQESSRAERLLQRGAIYASRDSALDALRSIASATDLRRGNSAGNQSLTAAIAAIRESGDFMGRYGSVDAERLGGMIASHTTPVLKGVAASELTPLQAANYYLDFAREELTHAAGGFPQAAHALQVLSGAESQCDLHPIELRESIAISCLRAAVQTDSKDARLANELGYRAMKLGLLDEAQWALEKSLEIEPTRPALQNLIETHRLAGDLTTARQLVAQLDAMGGPGASQALDVVQVPAEVFATISPPVQFDGRNSNSPSAYNSTPAPANDATPYRNGVQPAASVPPPQGTVSVMDRVAGAVRGLWK